MFLLNALYFMLLPFVSCLQIRHTMMMVDPLPSVLIKENIRPAMGNSWSYGDLFDLSDKKIIEAISITSDGKNAIAIDNDHANGITSNNLHFIKLFPENIDTLLQNLINNHVNVDILDVPKNEFFDLISKIGEAFYNISIYFFVFTFVIQLLSNFGGMPGGGLNNNVLNQMNSKKELVDVKNLNTTFLDVAGCDEAKFELMEVVDFLKNPDKYEEAGATIPKGVLLEGNPGTGKTLLARAVAGEAEVPFLSASGSEFIEMFVGVGASRVRNLFEKARENSPCVIFIDEIDAVGRKRGAGIAGGNDEREQTLNQILTNMDGFTASEGIVVIAATNRIDVLDTALIRPGRFDRKVKVGLPDKIGRKKIFDVHLKNKKLDNNFNVDEMVSLTTGFSGADIANLVNEAAIYSVRSNSTKINQTNILDAYEKITIGLPSSTNQPSESEIELVSYHEIGHAFLVALFQDMFDLRKITINENKNGAGGYTLFTPKEQYQKYATKRFVLANLIIAMGGRAAEVYLYRSKMKRGNAIDSYIFNNFKDLDITTGAINDLKQANELAKNYITEYGFGDNLCYRKEDTNVDTPFLARDMNNNKGSMSDLKKCDIDTQTDYLVDFAYKKAFELISMNSQLFEKLASQLRDEKTLTGNIVNEKVEIILNKDIIDYNE